MLYMYLCGFVALFLSLPLRGYVRPSAALGGPAKRPRTALSPDSPDLTLAPLGHLDSRRAGFGSPAAFTN